MESDKFKKLINQKNQKIKKILTESSDQFLIPTINTISSQSKIGGIGIINNIEELILNDFIPKFVNLFFSIRQIKNLKISKMNFGKRITRDLFRNIELINKYLTNLNPNFRMPKITFNNGSIWPSHFPTTFFYTFLNIFWLKPNKEQLYARCANFYYDEEDDMFTHYDDFRELSSYEIYFRLLSFLNTKSRHTYDSIPKTDENAKEIFKLAKIPMLINNDFLKVSSILKIPDTLFYLLQFIFNSIDKSPSLFVAEKFLKSMKVLSQIKLLDFKTINMSIQIKSFQSNKNDQQSFWNDNGENEDEDSNSDSYCYDNENDYDKDDEDGENNDNFDDDESNDNFDGDNENNDNFNDDGENNNNFGEIELNNKLKFKNGIIFIDDKKIDEMSQYWEKEMTQIEEVKNDAVNFSEKPKIFELFSFDNSKNQWEFNLLNYQSLIDENAINDKKVPLVLFVDSDEQLVLKIAANLLDCFPPNPKDLPNKIHVYGMCKNLNKKICSNSEEICSIKPIFLILHVPENENNNNNQQLELFLIQMYSFLSVYSNYQITILEKDTYYHQVKIIQLINEFNNLYEKEENQTNKFLFLTKDYQMNKNAEFLYQFLPQQILENTQFEPIQIDNLTSYCSILNFMNSIESIQLNSVDSIKIFFSEINEKIISVFFISFNIDGVSENNVIKEIQLLMTKSGKSIDNCDYDYKTLSNICEKIVLNTPFLATEFVKKCHEYIVYLYEKLIINKKEKKSSSKPINSDIESRILEELEKSSKDHLSKIPFLNHEVSEINEEQVNNFANSHRKILTDSCFKVIKSISNKNSIGTTYQKYIDVLNTKMHDDIESNFSSFMLNWNKNQDIKRMTIKEKILKGVEKGLNYAMRQTQNLKESQITVVDDADFEKKIPQDF